MQATQERFRAIISSLQTHIPCTNITFITPTKILNIQCEKGNEIEQILYTTVGIQMQPEIYTFGRMLESGDYTFWIKPKIQTAQFNALIFIVEPTTISNFAISQMLIKQMKAFGYQPSHVYELDRRSGAETIPFYRKTRSEIEKISEQLTITTNKILDKMEGNKTEHAIEGNFGTIIKDIVDPNEEIIKKLDQILNIPIPLTEDQIRKIHSETQLTEDQIRKIHSETQLTEDQIRKIHTETQLTEEQIRKIVSETQTSCQLTEDRIRKILRETQLTEEQMRKIISETQTSCQLTEDQIRKILRETQLTQEQIQTVITGILSEIHPDEIRFKKLLSEIKFPAFPEKQIRTAISDILSESNKGLITTSMTITETQTNKLLSELLPKIAIPVSKPESNNEQIEFYKKKLSLAEDYILKLMTQLKGQQ